MTEYDFNNLDDYEFEILCRDLFNEEQRLIRRSNNGLSGNKIIYFKSFKRGKDSGIDLYYEDSEHKVVGQVKLCRGKFSELFTTLKRNLGGKSEIEKVKELNPSKYIFMTSVPLSLENKKKIIELFEPYILTINDVYGREDLNNLLTSIEHVEKRHMKLYLNNPLVLERLMNSATFNRSLLSLEQVKLDVKYFVQTDNFLNSIKLIDENKLLIIKGLPGVGKTTLAKMLSLYYVEKGYTFIEILDLDNELERLTATEGKVILYYNDFLGSNTFTVAEALRHESRLSNLLRRVITSSDKILILTTRTNILVNAELESEKLHNIFSSVSKYEVDASDLRDREKRQILMKHIEKNDLNIEMYSHIYDEIIYHKNFNPRLIEFIASYIKSEKDLDVKKFVVRTLDNPSEVWSFAYEKQTNYQSKIYLNHLFLFGDTCTVKKFELSFKNRIIYETQINSFASNHSEFRECTTLMDHSFIKINSNLDYSEDLKIEFINPSFVDFLLEEIKKNKELITNSVKAFDNLEIIANRFNHEKKELEKLIPFRTLENLLLNLSSFEKMCDEGEKMEYLKICSNYFTIQKICQIFEDEIYRIIENKVNEDFIDEYLSFSIKFHELPKVKKHFKNNFSNIISDILIQTKYKETFDDTINLFDRFKFDIKYYTSDYNNEKIFYSTLKKVMEEEIENNIIFRNDRLRSIEEVENFYLEITREYSHYLHKLYAPDDFLNGLLDAQDWNSIIKYNHFRSSGISNKIVD